MVELFNFQIQIAYLFQLLDSVKMYCSENEDSRGFDIIETYKVVLN